MTDKIPTPRCDVCGSPISMIDGESLLCASWDDMIPDHPDVTDQMAKDAITDALKAGNTTDDLLLTALDDNDEFVCHSECYKDSTLYYDRDES